MSILNIRNLPDDVHHALRQRAAQNGTSMEAEARAILTAAVRPARVLPAEQLQVLVDQLCGENRPANVVEGLLEERRKEAKEEP
jgi:plasmid stability protein